MRKTTPKTTKTARKGDTLRDLLSREPEPRPAFRAFKLEDEWHGKNLLRHMVWCMHGGKHLPNVFHGLSTLHEDAIGKPAEWTGYFNEAREIILREKHKPIPPEEAAAELIGLALDAVKLVKLLYQKNPDLCRKVARTLGEWPVSTDLTAKNWARDAERTIADLGLGSAIVGYLKSARTSDENPIRLYATAIYETLYQTRWDYKRADGKDPAGKYSTREGCPAWAAKTLGLPKFIKAHTGAWLKVGREMLLEQRPDFIEDDALHEQKFKWTKRATEKASRGIPTRKGIWNEAFTDIGKELKNLAPEEDLFRGEW